MSPTIQVDPRLLDHAQRQVEGHARHVARLARRDVSAEEFFSQFLARLNEALAAQVSAVWLTAGEGPPKLTAQTSSATLPYMRDPTSRLARTRLAAQVIATGNARWVTSDDESFPTAEGEAIAGLLLWAPIQVEGRVVGAVEVLQRPGTEQAAWRGYLRFVEELAELSADFLFRRHARGLQARHGTIEGVDAFAAAVHAHLDVAAAATTLANEGRRLVGCDRITVLTHHGSRCMARAVSGQDSFDPRANQVRLLEQLATAVVRMREPLWFDGRTDDLPPQVERILHDYLDVAHTRSLAVVPLRREAELGARSDALGAVVFEEFATARSRESWQADVDLVARHARTALGNAVEHSSLFLLPVWRALGKLEWIVAARTLPKTIAVMMTLLGMALALVVVPWDFSIESRGTVQPAIRRDVFAPQEGVVETVHIATGQMVEPGTLLVELRNTSLETQITALEGQRTATQEQLASVERAIFDEARRLTPEEQNRLQGERAELRQRLANIEQQATLLEHQRAQLAVRSPIRGQVTTWNVIELLDHRPVTPGQVLVSVADVRDRWELELRVPEADMGHVLAAQRALGESLEVRFLLATEPGRSYRGQIERVHQAAETRSDDEGSTVLVCVSFDQEEVDLLRPGADVRARIHCGRRSLGYVLFRDVIEFVQSRILFVL